MQCFSVIIQTGMKGKNNKKSNNITKGTGVHQSLSHQDFKVKFDVLANDISCFFVKKELSRQASHKEHCQVRQIDDLNSSASDFSENQENADQKQACSKKRSVSPDFIRELPNAILSKIQQKGIQFEWKEEVEETSEIESIDQQNVNLSIWNAFEKSSASTTQNFLLHNKNSFQNIQSSFGYELNNTFQSCESLTYSHISNFEEGIYLQPHSYETQVSYGQSIPFAVLPDYICYDWRTTLMIRNIPNRYNVNQLADEIDRTHANTYDFLYLPCDPKNFCNVGYGFINFVSTDHLKSFYLKFNKTTWKKYRSEKICSLTYARLQGLSSLIEHFSNSKVLNQKDKKYGPIFKREEIIKIVKEQQRL